MAIQTGNIKYRGSFKSIRQYMNLHDPASYAGEKGGANRDLILNNPAFARTRENMNEFGGVGLAVKAIRLGMLNLLPEQTDRRFTARLMKVVKEINRRDDQGLRGKRSIFFSADRPFLGSVNLSVLEDIAEMLQDQFVCEHPITRAEATLTLTGFAVKEAFVPKGATHYRIQNHLSIISDYTYSEVNRRYEPLSVLNKKNAHTYSEYVPVGTSLTDDLVTAFPVGTTLTDEVSVIQCVGIEFFQMNATNKYSLLKGSGMKIVEVF
jgi:hypothetical protein